MQSRRIRQYVILASILVAGLGLSTRAFADEHIKGVITARGDDGTVTLRADDTSMVTIVLNDLTKVRRTSGGRERKVEAAELIPGLRVHVHGEYETANRFIAEKVKFSRDDLRMALAIHGGVEPTDRRSLENQARSETNALAIQQQRQILERQNQQLANNAAQIRANAASLDAAIAAANARFADLSNFNVISTMTVHFRNGSAKLDRKYRAQLEQFAAQARGTRGYMVQVQGFASAVGPDALNERLSFQRAQIVAAVLTQNGVPPTNMLAPATMGVSVQVASNKTARGQAENRRAVVTLLQNKGLTEQARVGVTN